MKFFNTNAITAIPHTIKTAPRHFKYGFVPNIFQENAYKELRAKFPPFSSFGYIDDGFKKVYEGPHFDSVEHKGYVDHLLRAHVDPIWIDLLREAHSQEFTKLFSESTGIGFNAVRNFSWKYGKEGCEITPHLDLSGMKMHSAGSKIVCMFGFAKNPGAGPGGTTVYDVDRETVLMEAPETYNGMTFFEQHQDAWHGYKTLKPDQERWALAITFNRAREPVKIRTSFLNNILGRRAS